MSARSGPPVLDGFTYVHRLGGGGFADVYAYEQVSLGRRVAIKVMSRGFGQAGLESFRREASLMAKLSNHPSIVSIYSSGVARDGRPFLVMEMCATGHLGTRIADRPYSVPNALTIGVQIAGAVETSHRLGILHRDIKPANILFTEFGRPALTDFGISSTGEASAVDKALSPLWASPEQFGGSGATVGPASDVYALAATIWAMLVGRSPMEVPGGENDKLALRQRAFTLAPPPTGRPDVPPSLEGVLATAMAKRPQDRYSSAWEFALALQQVQIELHQGMTTIDILDDHATAAPENVSETGTVVSRYVVLDPDRATSGSGTRTSPHGPGGGDTLTAGPNSPSGYVLQHGRGVSDAIEPLDFTGHAAPSLVSDPTVLRDFKASGSQAESLPRKLPVGLLAAVGVVGVAVVAAGGWLTLSSLGAGTARPTASATARPQDPIGIIVPPVAGLTVVREGDQVRATWTNPDAKSGDTFLYEVKDPSRPAEPMVTKDATALVRPIPGRTCVAVSLRRANGTLSTESVKCVES